MISDAHHVSPWSARTGCDTTTHLRPLPLPLAAAIATVDDLRRRWFASLGGVGRALIRERETRVACVFSAAVTFALIGSVIAPFWLLLLTPVVFGVPHVVADIRYLVVRSGYASRPRLALIGGATLLWMATGGPLMEGLFGTAIVVMLARAQMTRRLAVAGALVLFAIALDRLGPYDNVAFAHLHNFTPVLLWWIWRRRTSHRHWIPIALTIGATAFLVSPAALELVHATGGLDWFSPEMGPDAQRWRLAGALEPSWGLRLVMLFCFSQSIHYALWLHVIPDEDQDRATPLSFRATVEGLRVDLGDVGVAVAIALSLGVAGWATFDLIAANEGYFRMAQFHAHLEVMALGLMVVEGRRGAAS